MMIFSTRPFKGFILSQDFSAAPFPTFFGYSFQNFSKPAIPPLGGKGGSFSLSLSPSPSCSGVALCLQSASAALASCSTQWESADNKPFVSFSVIRKRNDSGVIAGSEPFASLAINQIKGRYLAALSGRAKYWGSSKSSR